MKHMNLERDSIKFLKEVFSQVGYDINKTVIMDDIAKTIRIEDENYIQAIVRNLENEGYLKNLQQFGVRSDSITTSGIKKVESNGSVTWF